MDKKRKEREKKNGRKNCKTCNCEYRQEIEEMYLMQGYSAQKISDHLNDKYGYKISAAALLNHFKICLDKKENKKQKDAESEAIRQKVLEKKIELVDMLWEVISYIYVINIKLHKQIINGAKANRTTSDLVRNYTGELREYAKLYKNLNAENTNGILLNEAELIARYEEYRKKNAQLLSSSFEEKEEEKKEDEENGN